MPRTDYPIAHAPEMTRDQFAAVLRDAGSPAASEAGEMYDALVTAGVSPAVFLGFFRHESGYGRLGVAYDYSTRSPGNVRTPHDPQHGGTLVNVPGRGQFTRYPTWTAGTADWAARLLGPTYAGAGLTTVRTVLPVYAPRGDNNNPDAYAAAVLADVEKWGQPVAFDYPGQSQGPWAQRPVDILLHGTRGGASSRAREFTGTCNWVVNNSDGLAWHVTVGDNVYAQHLPITEWGWHAREASRVYIGVEFVQPGPDDTITDGQVAAFGRWYRAVVAPVYPHLTAQSTTLPAHSEVPAGKRDGKSDVFPAGDARLQALRARLWAAMAGVEPADLSDIELEREYQRERALLGDKRFKAHIDRPGYQGPVLVAERGVVGPNPAATATIRGILTDDVVTYLEANNVLRRL